MVRTVISLSEDDKAWLDGVARERGVPMAEVVRLAVRTYREEAESATWDEVLAETRGIWKRGDGLTWQEKVRDEWGP